MCSAALHVAFSSSVSSLASPSCIARTPCAGSSWIRPLRPSQRVFRVGSIRGFAGEGGAGSDKEETSPTGDNGGGGAAVSDTAKGFGAGVRAGGAAEKKKKSQTIRRSAPQQPLLQSAPQENQVSQIESAFVVALGLFFGLIFVEGITLAASGFLPEEWDEFLVKSLYPSFTPSVGLFLVAAAGYGVFKYLGLDPSKK